MKCKSCGAEIDSNSRTCKFCGSQITMDMLKEQETLNKQGCPKCGSTNITFRRENQGEVRGKNYKQVVHRTVGYCKDCGETWYPSSESEMPKKRKTWLWILGWIFIFPVPLTILMLRKKDMKPAVKYGIIAVAWIIYLIIGFSGNSSDKNANIKTSPSDQNSVSSTDELKTIDVTLNVTPKVNDEDGSVLFCIETNLPEDTELMVTVTNGKYIGQDKTVVLANGFAYTSEFSNKGKALKGTYTVSVSMSLPSLQKDSVREVIGQKGEYITGQYVEKSEITNENCVNGDFKFKF